MLPSRLGPILRSLIRRRRFESEMTEEVRFHIDRRTDDLMSLEGLSRDEALRRARLEFGSFEKYKEEARQAFGLRWIDELRADGRYALRQLKTPSYTITGLLTIGLTVGGIATVFAFIDSILLNPLPFPESHRLVRLTTPNPVFPGCRGDCPIRTIGDMRGASRSFDAVAALQQSHVRGRRRYRTVHILSSARQRLNCFPCSRLRPISGASLCRLTRIRRAPGDCY